MIDDNKLESLRPAHHRTKLAVREMAGLPIADSPCAVAISNREYDDILGAIKQASALFTRTAKEQIPNRARNFFDTAEPSPEQAIKAVFSHRDFGRTKGKVLQDAEAMKMIESALRSDVQEVRLFCTGFPMKIFNPLETNYQGDTVDLSDVSALLRFAEIAEVLNHFGQPLNKKFSVSVVADGRMNIGMFKVDPKVCDSYVTKLNAMIRELGISSLVSVQEFSLLLDSVPRLKRRYEATTKRIKAECHEKFDCLLSLDHLDQSIEWALKVEGRDYDGSSFGHLFNSTIGSVRYEGIERLSTDFGLSFAQTYSSILESILWNQDLRQSRLQNLLATLPEHKRAEFVEAAAQERSATLKHAWQSTVEYFAVLQVNKVTRVLDALFPPGIRVTTRPKQGQIGIHTSDQSCPSLFSYHSVPAILPCNKGKNVKVDFQLRYNVLRHGFRPLLLNGADIVGYLHPSLSSLPIEQLPWIRGSK